MAVCPPHGVHIPRLWPGFKGALTSLFPPLKFNCPALPVSREPSWVKARARLEAAADIRLHSFHPGDPGSKLTLPR